jgi:O-antigen ligase
MGLLPDHQHRNLTFIGLALVAIGLPLSVFLMSVGQFVLIGNWLLERDHRRRLRQFVTDPLSMVLSSVWLAHLVGVLWAPDTAAALADVRVKLPLVLLPLVLFTSRMPEPARLRQVLYLFVLATVAGSLVGLVNYLGLSGQVIVEKRHLSVFISHIRFSMMVVMSMLILGHFLEQEWKRWGAGEKVFVLLLLVWLFYFLVLLESATGYLVFVALLGLYLLRKLLRARSVAVRGSAAMLLVGALFAGFFYVNSIYRSHQLDFPFVFEELPQHTANGREYEHYPARHFKENGHRMWNMVCEPELEIAWPSRSAMHIDSSDLRGQRLRFTLMRYLTSLGLPKDSLGVMTLSATDVRNVELGFTNHRYTQRWGVSRRLAEFFWQWDNYVHTGDPNNSTLIQRIVYAQVGMDIARQHPLIGVGTGGLVWAYHKAYDKEDRGLLPQFRLIAHNQFLATAICLGLPATIWFIFSLLFPLKRMWRSLPYVGFLLIITLSFLSDNTLGSQAGVTLYAFLNALLIVVHGNDRAAR